MAAPDHRLGEHVAAFLLLRPGCALPTMDDVRAHFGRAGLAKQKWPEELHEIAEFPRTPSGKVQKVRLRQRLAALQAGQRGTAVVVAKPANHSGMAR